MMRAPAAIALLLSLAVPAVAQDPAPVYQQQKKGLQFHGDTLARYEWTRDIPVPDGVINDDRYWFQARPRVELSAGPFSAGVGGAFNYGDEENDLVPEGADELLLVRDNFRTQDARLDLAYGKISVGPVEAQGGRFFMPIPFTEMIWDRDLRPQGGALSFSFGDAASARVGLMGIYATGSHVYEDESEMFGGAAEVTLPTGQSSRLQLLGAYLQFEDLDGLQTAIRRQNTRVAGLIVNDYQIVDLVARLSTSGQLPITLVADYCWNTAVDADNKGLWLSAVLGALGTSRARLEYVYAKIDKDATVAAFNTDDFFWNTGWEGHRLDLGTGTVKSSSIHAVAQLQRFKDSPDPLVREEWVHRYRVEWRTRF
jgi:hypothetical protein